MTHKKKKGKRKGVNKDALQQIYFGLHLDNTWSN